MSDSFGLFFYLLLSAVGIALVVIISVRKNVKLLMKIEINHRIVAVNLHLNRAMQEVQTLLKGQQPERLHPVLKLLLIRLISTKVVA